MLKGFPSGIGMNPVIHFL
jgi:hypothetical protein